MPDYNFNGLSPRSFEHMTQALALKNISSAVTPFGDGPDGGREATCQGLMDYPTVQAAWNGYLVIQCKFLQKPSGNASREATWAVEQIKEELSKFEDVTKGLTLPEYYIFVTNATLSPVPKTGGKARVFKAIAPYAQRLGFKDYDVWDYDKLRTLLDGQVDIRSAYAHLLTPGDVLTAMKARLDEIGASSNQRLLDDSFWSITALFLQKELRRDQFARLEHAHDSADGRISLANVFVDLPATRRPSNDPPIESEENWLKGIVQTLLEVGSGPLKRSVVYTTHEKEERGELDEIIALNRSTMGRAVLVGGPGQGKSTVTQFLCQLYRASILSDIPQNKLTQETADLLENFRRQCNDCKIELPQARRFPISVSLPLFAAELANGQSNSLIQYISRRMEKVTTRGVQPNDMRVWLEHFPWLLILDGLDEVPSTSNRREVMEAISAFWDDVTNLDADILVVATTRPQGYDQDFSPKYYSHLYMTPLSSYRAIHYGRRLLETRYSTNNERAELLTSRLYAACASDTTTRLMRSPLQVTIMATLVERGLPPQERWRLFDQYYRLVYQRELDRDIATSHVLGEHQNHVDVIHRRVGLLLQVESERAGHTEAQLSRERLEEVVRNRYREVGFDSLELTRKTQEFSQAALIRLVFLVALQEGTVGFEIRSLQEFMAAQALLAGSDVDVSDRLKAIAPVAHWRNVFLFAAGQIFAEREFLHHVILSICSQLNSDENSLLGSVLAGSRLALDLLLDGIGRNSPAIRNSLLREALRLLELPDEETTFQLAELYETSTQELFRRAVRERLALTYNPISPFEERLGAWVVVKALAAKNIQWAQEAIEEFWPVSNEQSFQILNAAGSFTTPTIPVQEVAKALCSQNYSASCRLARTPGTFRQRGAATPQSWEEAIFHLCNTGFDRGSRISSAHPERSEVEFHVASIDRTSPTESWYQHLSGIPVDDNCVLHANWHLIREAGRFAQSPNKDALADALRSINSSVGFAPWSRYLAPLGMMPWPLAACISTAESSADLEQLAYRAENGRLGDTVSWREAESRWLRHGITLDDLAVLETTWPFDEHIAVIGYPLVAASIQIHTPSGNSVVPSLEFLVNEWRSSNHEDLRAYRSALLTGLIRGISSHLCENADVNIEDIRQIWRESSAFPFSLDSLFEMKLPDPFHKEWLSLFDYLGQEDGKGRRVLQLSPVRRWDRSEELSYAYNSQSAEFPGLLHILSALCLSGCQCPVSSTLLRQSFATDEDRFAALTIYLHLNHWNTEVETLAAELTELVLKEDVTRALHSSSFLDLALMVFDSHNIDPAYQERFLVQLNVQLRAANYPKRENLILYLVQMMKLKRSQLSDELQWSRLHLPELPF